jgi:uncharacterized membrane protein HdeD (DUF308 family)
MLVWKKAGQRKNRRDATFFQSTLRFTHLKRWEVHLLPTNMLAVNSANVGLFAGRWWAVLLRGVVALVFGALSFSWPAVTLDILVLLFGCYALLDGGFSLVAAIGGRNPGDRWLLVFEGVVGIWAGVVTLRAPAIGAAVLVFFISIWAMATGFLRIVAAIHLRKQNSGEIRLALSALLSVLFALTLMLRPGLGTLVLVWVIAGFAVAIGGNADHAGHRTANSAHFVLADSSNAHCPSERFSVLQLAPGPSYQTL